MGQIQTEEKVIHPEGKILLINGNTIDGYPNGNPSVIVKKNGLQLDTTGEYLQIGRKKRKIPNKVESPYAHTRDMLIKNAWTLYDRREEIYADSRMFLAPLNIGCNIAYTGTSGIADATLGVWLEWWESLDILRIDKEGKECLTYYFAGSPLSGTNRCKGVSRSGQEIDIQFCPFTPVWSTFMRINSRYTEPKQIYEAYTFEQTIEKLEHTTNVTRMTQE